MVLFPSLTSHAGRQVQPFSNRMQCTSTKATKCLVFRGDVRDLEIRKSAEGAVEDEIGFDQDGIAAIVRALRRWWIKSKKSAEYIPSSIVPSSRRPTWKQNEIEPARFFDYIGEVRSTSFFVKAVAKPLP